MIPPILAITIIIAITTTTIIIINIVTIIFIMIIITAPNTAESQLGNIQARFEISIAVHKWPPHDSDLDHIFRFLYLLISVWSITSGWPGLFRFKWLVVPGGWMDILPLIQETAQEDNNYCLIARCSILILLLSMMIYREVKITKSHVIEAHR